LQFESANTLLALSAAPTAVRAAIEAYCQLLSRESDNNVKLVILGRLVALKRKQSKFVREVLLDIMRTLASPNVDIRRMTLQLALDLLSPRNVESVVGMLKKEMVRSDQGAGRKGAAAASAGATAYRHLLVDTLHKCAVQFPAVVPSVVGVLINYIGDDNANSALDVAYFVREIVEENPAMRQSLLKQLLNSFSLLRSPFVFRVALWVLGEYVTADGNGGDNSDDACTIQEVLAALRDR
jgi:coatomer subunit beta